jgi:2,5-dihydroxypyridine 5,6-dioxygenase
MVPMIMRLPNARKVIRVLGEATAETNILILHDPFTALNAEALAIAASEIGTPCAMLQVMPGGHHGTQLSAMAAAAMKACNLLIAPMRSNIAHTHARREAQAQGVKVIVLPEAHGDDFFLARGWSADFAGLRPKIDGLAAALGNATVARVRSRDGTDITMSIAGRRGRSLNGFANTVDISAGYCLEASVAPVEGTAEGIIVVNASIPGIGLTRSGSVVIKVEKGMAVSIEGGPEAAVFRDLLAGFNDPNVYNLGELGVGMNPECRLDGTMLSDESVWGAFQLALGTSAPGGVCQAAAHYDTVLTDATLELDGVVVFEGEELRLPA